MIMNSKFLKISKNDEEQKNFLLKSKNSNFNSFKKPNSLKINTQCFIWCPTCSYSAYCSCPAYYHQPMHPVIRLSPLRN